MSDKVLYHFNPEIFKVFTGNSFKTLNCISIFPYILCFWTENDIDFKDIEHVVFDFKTSLDYCNIDLPLEVPQVDTKDFTTFDCLAFVYQNVYTGSFVISAVKPGFEANGLIELLLSIHFEAELLRSSKNVSEIILGREGYQIISKTDSFHRLSLLQPNDVMNSPILSDFMKIFNAQE
jgi:hypothetical protein